MLLMSGSSKSTAVQQWTIPPYNQSIYSQRVTEKLVKEVSESLIRVVVDYNLSTKKSRSEIDTGKFICIHKGNNIAEKPISVGLNLCLEGKSIKR
jgi:tubulin monoglycylase TTLL3/8